MNPKLRYRCAIRKFLALALADDVFVHYKAPEDFENRWMSTTATSRELHIRDDKKNIPIFRKAEGSQISSTLIMAATSTNYFVKDICEQCGYPEPVTTYTFRRGMANNMEGNSPHPCPYSITDVHSSEYQCEKNTRGFESSRGAHLACICRTNNQCRCTIHCVQQARRHRVHEVRVEYRLQERLCSPKTSKR
jgi:hypothetical protein